MAKCVRLGTVSRLALHGILGLRNRHFVLLDLIAFVVAPSFALYLRTEDWGLHSTYYACLMTYTFGAACVRLLVFWRYDLYRRYWRYASIDDLLNIALAVAVSSAAVWVLFAASVMANAWAHPLPRSVPLISSLLVLLAVGISRCSVRMAQRLLRQAPRGDAKRVLIIGAGRHGQFIARELLSNPEIGLRPVGFLDDDQAKQGSRILNLPVLGGRDRAAQWIGDQDVDEVIIAMPGTPGPVIRECVLQCEQAHVPAKTVPGVEAMLTGRFRADHLRRVEIGDLLRREPIETDIAAVRELVRGKRVLVTGAGGSIGSELCRQVLACGPAQLILLGHGENSIFEIEGELRARLLGRAPGSPETRLSSAIADIRSATRLRHVMDRYQPHIVFHAAAHKHVPLMEANPTEAVANNVLGTHNVLQAAEAVGVEHLVMVSTDKAVNPTSVMGASKRAAELLVLSAARRTGRPYVAVRFGNVLGSRGSVVPVFKRQIAEGGPVTVSHPDMRRFFITIPEAVQLVLQAAVLGCGGEVFILDMGEPVRIVDLARDLIQLSGLQPDRDIGIVFTGVRPGEKLFEELYVEGESYERTCHTKILIAQNASSFVPAGLPEALRAAAQAVENDDALACVECLSRMVSEYHPGTARARAKRTDVQIPVAERASGEPERRRSVVTGVAPVGGTGG